MSFQCKKSVDHLGQEFNSISEMINYWGINKGEYDYRSNLGWSLEEILTGNRESKPIIRSGNKCIDHNGREYKSIAEMCREYNISSSMYKQRVKAGWSSKCALLVPSRKKHSFFDHKGIQYNTLEEKCNAYNITVSTYKCRINRGLSEQEALELPNRNDTRRCKDHNGKEFESRTKMCEYWNIDVNIFDFRIKKGWDIRSALIIPINLLHNRTNSRYIGIDGILYYYIKSANQYLSLDSISDMIEKGELAV